MIPTSSTPVQLLGRSYRRSYRRSYSPFGSNSPKCNMKYQYQQGSTCKRRKTWCGYNKWLKTNRYKYRNNQCKRYTTKCYGAKWLDNSTKSSRSDATCRPYTKVCGSGKWLDNSTKSKTSNATCRPYTQCGPGKWANGGTNTSDVACEDYTTSCGSGQWLDNSTKSTTSNATCRPYTQCGSGKWADGGTDTSDVVCKNYTTSCPSEKLPTPRKQHLDTMTGARWLDESTKSATSDATCRPFTEKCYETEKYRAPGPITEDRGCLPLTTSCPSGQWLDTSTRDYSVREREIDSMMEGAEREEDSTCRSCPSDHYLDETVAQRNKPTQSWQAHFRDDDEQFEEWYYDMRDRRITNPERKYITQIYNSRFPSKKYLLDQYNMNPCVPITDCHKQGKVVETAATLTSDAVCGAPCPSGTILYAASNKCVVDCHTQNKVQNGAVCGRACTDNEYLDPTENRCKPSLGDFFHGATCHTRERKREWDRRRRKYIYKTKFHWKPCTDLANKETDFGPTDASTIYGALLNNVFGGEPSNTQMKRDGERLDWTQNKTCSQKHNISIDTGNKWILNRQNTKSCKYQTCVMEQMKATVDACERRINKDEHGHRWLYQMCKMPKGYAARWTHVNNSFKKQEKLVKRICK